MIFIRARLIFPSVISVGMSFSGLIATDDTNAYVQAGWSDGNGGWYNDNNDLYLPETKTALQGADRYVVLKAELLDDAHYRGTLFMEGIKYVKDGDTYSPGVTGLSLVNILGPNMSQVNIGLLECISGDVNSAPYSGLPA